MSSQPHWIRLLEKSTKMLAKHIFPMAITLVAFSGCVNAEEKTLVTRADVGFVDIDKDHPRVTDICWMDLRVGSADTDAKRIEISLYGNIGALLSLFDSSHRLIM